MTDYEAQRAQLRTEALAMVERWKAENAADAIVQRRLMVATVAGGSGIVGILVAMVAAPSYAPGVAAAVVAFAVVVCVAMWAWAIVTVRGME